MKSQNLPLNPIDGIVLLAPFACILMDHLDDN
jgi:hypothetical protein